MSRAELEQFAMEATQHKAELHAKLKWYEEQNQLSKAKRFCTASEQTPMEQLSLFNEAEAENYGQILREPLLEEAVLPAKRKRKKQVHKEAQTEGLPTTVIEYHLSEEERSCPDCGGELHEIKQEVRKELVIIPASVQVKEHVRFVYACRNCQQHGERTPIVAAVAPKPLFPGSLCSASLLAEVMHNKYTNALPLYWQEQEFQRLGISLSRQTLSNWVVKGSQQYLQPLYDSMKQQLRKEPVLHADETVLEVLREPGREASANSYMWLYRTGAGCRHSLVLYEYTKGRSGASPKAFLEGFSGYLHTDSCWLP